MLLKNERKSEHSFLLLFQALAFDYFLLMQNICNMPEVFYALSSCMIIEICFISLFDKVELMLTVCHLECLNFFYLRSSRQHPLSVSVCLSVCLSLSRRRYEFTIEIICLYGFASTALSVS